MEQSFILSATYTNDLKKKGWLLHLWLH